MIKDGITGIDAIYHGIDKIQKSFSGYDMVFDEFSDYKIVGKFDSTSVQSPTINYNSNNALTVTTSGDYFFVETIPSNATSIKIPSTSKVTSILKFDFAPTSMSTAFENCADLIYVDFSQSDFSNCTHLGWCFKNTGFTSLTLDIDTTSLTNLQSAFNYMSNLTEIDLSRIDTSSVTTMRTMFQNDSNLETINLSNFDMTNVTDYGYMFQNCSKLTTLILNDVDNDTFAKLTNYGTSYLPKTVTIIRDGDTYIYDSTQDTWVVNS